MAWLYLRRLLQAVIILSLYSHPVLQVILSVKLNFFDLAFNIALQPYNDRGEKFQKAVNGTALMLILYSLMLFTGQFMADKE